MYQAIKALETYSRLTWTLDLAIMLIKMQPAKDDVGGGDPALEYAISLLEVVMSMACAAYSRAYDDVLKTKRAA